MASSQPTWLIVVARLPGQPSRHRVAVWRELRRVGALPLGGGTWALPVGRLAEDAISQIRGIVRRAEDGELFVLGGIPHDDSTGSQLEQTYTAAVEAEWQEFLSDCDKYEAELDRELASEKFTLAELEEEEQSLERLRRWHRALNMRDRFGAASAGEAQGRLDACGIRLEGYAERVYSALGQ